ncbi:MAG: flotillin family protein [Bacteroidetes bacterium]|nr:flotillin family protein [Bacteroidota bacterium]
MVTLGAIGFFTFLLILFFISRYKRCPSDKILVVYGRTGTDQSAKCYAGGAAFIWPVIQDYEYLDLKPIPIDVNLQDALSKQNIRVSVPAQFTVGISNKPELMIAAAERLLGLQRNDISSLAHDIIMGQMRLVIANMDIEELNVDRDKFVESVYGHVGEELHKIGLELINVNVTDIHDESSYIKALGQEAAAKAINDAKVKVAMEERSGSIGQAEAKQEQRTKVAQANSRAEIGEAEASAAAIEGKNLSEITVAESNAKRDVQMTEADAQAEIGKAEANAAATTGKNLSQIKVAESDAERDIRIAESRRRSIAAQKVAQAKAMQEAYMAEKETELARAEVESAKRKADEVVKASIEKEKAVIAAQAEAERNREIAKGDADAILSKLEAQAKGTEELLRSQAEGFKKLVDAAGGDAQSAIGLLLVDKLTELAEIQVSAIKNLDIDKVVVYDNGSGQGVGNLVQGLYAAVPQLNDFLNQAGLSLPNMLVKNPDGLEKGKARNSAKAINGTPETSEEENQ